MEIQQFIFVLAALLSYVASEDKQLCSELVETQIIFLDLILEEVNSFEHLAEAGQG